MVTQPRVRHGGRHEYQAHNPAASCSQINGTTVNEIVLLNSHDDTSNYQMLAGCSASFAAMACHGRLGGSAARRCDYSV
ncbi:DUF932 domain-containing protein [Vogesella fluminis]|uniref:DUF932 domain-containing protein n=1 Tax=Vogesella fluminis TaxID=1069161 RepID=UPI0035716D42